MRRPAIKLGPPSPIGAVRHGGCCCQVSVREARNIAAALVLACSMGACVRGAQPSTADTAFDAGNGAAGNWRMCLATSYSVKGKTAAGSRPTDKIVAADPRILPLGSRIRVDDAGAYSGEYVVTDTGRKVHGHHIDLFIADPAEAKRFGKKHVRVSVIERGDGHAASARNAAAAVAPAPP